MLCGNMKELLKKINNDNDAIKIIQTASIVNYILAGITFLFIYKVGVERLYDGLIHAAITFFLFKYKSRIAAILLMIFPIQKMFYVDFFSTYLMLGLILLIDLRAVEATFRLTKKEALNEQQ